MLNPFARAWFSVRPDAGDLWVGEHRRGHVPVVGRHQRIGVVPVLQEVVLDHAGLVVGDMLELIIRRHVPEGEDAARRGALVLVDDHLTAGRHLHAGLLRVEQVAVGCPAGGDQQQVAPHARAVLAPQLDAVAVSSDARDLAVAQDLPLLGRDIGEPLADRVVLTAQQRAAADHHRDAAAERREHVGEFACHEAAPDDHQVLGHIGDPHDGVAGVIAHPGGGDLVGDHGSRPGGDHHLVGGELVTVVGAQRVAAVGQGRPEPGVAGEHLDVGEERR